MIENLLLLTHVVVAIFLVIVVLLQRSDGGMGALGGDGAGAIFSSQSGANPLTRTTTILAVIFMGTSMLLAMGVAGDSKQTSVVDTVAVEESAPAADALPTIPVPVEGTVSE